GGGYGGNSSSGGDDDDDDASTESGRRRREQDLKNLIIKHVKGAWSEADTQDSGSGRDGGSTQAINPEDLEGKGRITIEGDRMIMTQTPSAHREVIRLFKLLRKFKDVQIAVEARFVSLRSNFLEQIGVDLDMILNQGQAGLDTALTTSTTGATGTTGTAAGAAVDPLTGAVLVMPRQMSALGFTPTVATTGGVAMDQTALVQPYNNVALVPTGSSNSWWDRHTTPIPLLNNSIGLAGPPTTSVPGNLSSVVNSAKPAFSMAGTFLDNLQVDFLLKATQMDSRGSSVDAPRLVCFNARQATIQVQTLAYYVVSPGFAGTSGGINSTGSQGQQPNISMVPKGRVFTVKPFVSADRKYVTLVVQPQVTDATFKRIPTQSGALASYFEVPEMQLTQILTGVKVPDGGTVLLGGLTLAAEEEVEAGVPVLSKIPVLKRAFTNRSRVKDEFVLLVLIKPTIIFQDEQEEKAYPDMMTSDGARQLGAF
ncbi:MAG TPA: hypothetical protein P5159_15040, partial [Phycisphaerae bacterium]|nr:hypothetical protein [Phycisphaerae bacterium]